MGPIWMLVSVCDYTRTQDAWFVGKPAYGYVTTKANGRPSLAIEPNAHKALRWARRMALRGVSARRVSLCLVRSGLMSEGLTTTTLLRRLRNPALMGYRVEENKNKGVRRSKLILGHDGKPVRVAEPIFTEDENNELQEPRPNGSSATTARSARHPQEAPAVPARARWQRTTTRAASPWCPRSKRN
ncbi:hypothetical protein K373_00057 [Streptomyces sp. DvalAA-21]|nr:hypothetical protein K373_00057 [Streptomyces sp. DvalAA-21]RAJ32380.1 hypothetical protein K351_03686 [Streptomyces sp. DpondAA-E10]RAJ47341.1 hypothetical protein K352_03081 [Streptomyces sp. DpondAA-A50]SCE09298.1 hypothetical protein GA0115235_111444 [Streptomyces sp. DpondAA-F4a]SCL95883.1 hypothetical protein SAMN04883147_104557 [Streptomyces sp. DpondAA-F4]